MMEIDRPISSIKVGIGTSMNMMIPIIPKANRMSVRKYGASAPAALDMLALTPPPAAAGAAGAEGCGAGTLSPDESDIVLN